MSAKEENVQNKALIESFYFQQDLARAYFVEAFLVMEGQRPQVLENIANYYAHLLMGLYFFSHSWSIILPQDYRSTLSHRFTPEQRQFCDFLKKSLLKTYREELGNIQSMLVHLERHKIPCTISWFYQRSLNKLKFFPDFDRQILQKKRLELFSRGKPGVKNYWRNYGLIFLACLMMFSLLDIPLSFKSVVPLAIGMMFFEGVMARFQKGVAMAESLELRLYERVERPERMLPPPEGLRQEPAFAPQPTARREWVLDVRVNPEPEVRVTPQKVWRWMLNKPTAEVLPKPVPTRPLCSPSDFGRAFESLPPKFFVLATASFLSENAELYCLWHEASLREPEAQAFLASFELGKIKGPRDAGNGIKRLLTPGREKTFYEIVSARKDRVFGISIPSARRPEASAIIFCHYSANGLHEGSQRNQRELNATEEKVTRLEREGT
jgi:hypothetical protein